MIINYIVIRVDKRYNKNFILNKFNEFISNIELLKETKYLKYNIFILVLV